MAKAAKTSSKVRKVAQEQATVPLSRNTLVSRAGIGFAVLVFFFIVTRPGVMGRIEDRVRDSASSINTHGGLTSGDGTLSSVFTSEVMYWRDDIIRWGQERNLNPNLIATIMQIESCGDPYISSGVGAQGLFQVMPLHFANGENQIDIETNAQRGLNHLQDCLRWTGYDVGVTFACYNGGPSVIGRPQSQWYEESRNYYTWGTGIYREATSGASSSSTLQTWLASGGSGLCETARNTQQLFTPNE